MNSKSVMMLVVLMGFVSPSLYGGFLDGLKTVGSGLVEIGNDVVDGVTNVSKNMAMEVRESVRSDDAMDKQEVPVQNPSAQTKEQNELIQQALPAYQSQTMAAGKSVYGKKTIERYINEYLHRIQKLDARAKKCGVRPRDVNSDTFVRQLFEQHCRSDDSKAILVSGICVDAEVEPLLKKLTRYWGENGKFDFPVTEGEYHNWTARINKNVKNIEDKCAAAEKVASDCADGQIDPKHRTMKGIGSNRICAKPSHAVKSDDHAVPADCGIEKRRLIREEVRVRLEKFLNIYLARFSKLDKLSEGCTVKLKNKRDCTSDPFVVQMYVEPHDFGKCVSDDNRYFSASEITVDASYQDLLVTLSEGSHYGHNAKTHKGFDCPEMIDDFQKWEDAVWQKFSEMENRCAQEKASQEQKKRLLIDFMREAYGLQATEKVIPQKAFRDIIMFGMAESEVRTLIEQLTGESITQYNVKVEKEESMPDGINLKVEKLPKLHVTFTFARFHPAVERMLVRVEITPNYLPEWHQMKAYGWKIDDIVARYKSEIPNSISRHQKYVKDELWGADDLSQIWKFLAFLTDAKIKRIKTGNPNGYGEQCDLSEAEKDLLKKCEDDLVEFKKLGLQPVYGERYEVVGKYVVVSMNEREGGERTGAITITDVKLESKMLKIAKAQKEEAEKIEREKRAKADREKMNF